MKPPRRRSRTRERKRARYQVYRTTSLAKPFEPWGAVVEAKADGLLDFAVETDGSPSAFFKVEPVK